MEHATDRDPRPQTLAVWPDGSTGRATRQESAERVRQAAATGEISTRDASDQLSVILGPLATQSRTDPHEARTGLGERFERIKARMRVTELA